MEESSSYIYNLNSALKNIKLEVMVDFIWSDSAGITIVTNKVASVLNLQSIENYIKSANHINLQGVEVPHLPQSKSYLKIIDISYLQENMSTPITSNVVKDIIKKNQIFNNIILALKSYIIKISPKSDMAIVWLDIWDVQSRSKAKDLINRCFNVRNYIATIRGANMNPGMSWCKNCWKWGYTTFSCRIQGAKYFKCNGPHKSKHYQQFAWCCKTNKKTNAPRLETKKGEPCLHSLKYMNYWGNHQADSNQCPFWRYSFNCEWHNKNFVKTEGSQFAQLWAVLKHNFKGHLYLFSKCWQEQFHHQHHSQKKVFIWHYIHLRAILVLYTIYSKFKQHWRGRTCRHPQLFQLDYVFQKSSLC